jgi:hypothetical protein
VKWEVLEGNQAAKDAADQTVIPGDHVIYTVGDRSSRRLAFGVIEKIARQGPFTHTYYPFGFDNGPVSYEYYDYKYWIKHKKESWQETGVSIIEGEDRIAAIPPELYAWKFNGLEEGS